MMREVRIDNVDGAQVVLDAVKLTSGILTWSTIEARRYPKPGVHHINSPKPGKSGRVAGTFRAPVKSCPAILDEIRLCSPTKSIEWKFAPLLVDFLAGFSGHGHGHFDVENWWSQYPQVAKQIMQLTTVGHTMLLFTINVQPWRTRASAFQHSSIPQSTTHKRAYMSQLDPPPAFVHTSTPTNAAASPSEIPTFRSGGNERKAILLALPTTLVPLYCGATLLFLTSLRP
ncbi:hypothetical protein AB1N83_007003 [Pleurotus pulmonarius]